MSYYEPAGYTELDSIADVPYANRFANEDFEDEAQFDLNNNWVPSHAWQMIQTGLTTIKVMDGHLIVAHSSRTLKAEEEITITGSCHVYYTYDTSGGAGVWSDLEYGGYAPSESSTLRVFIIGAVEFDGTKITSYHQHWCSDIVVLDTYVCP